MKTLFNFKIDRDLLDELRRVAKENDRTVSSQLVFWIKKNIREHDNESK